MFYLVSYSNSFSTTFHISLSDLDALAQDEILSAHGQFGYDRHAPSLFRWFYQGGSSGPGELHQRQPHHGVHPWRQTHFSSCLIYIFEQLVLHVWCLCVRVSGSASGVWQMFTLRRSSGSVATDVRSLLADCLGAADTHHHHANNADREGTGIHTWCHTLTECLAEHCLQDLRAMVVHTRN